jgi:hypothetical protein
MFFSKIFLLLWTYERISYERLFFLCKFFFLIFKRFKPLFELSYPYVSTELNLVRNKCILKKKKWLLIAQRINQNKSNISITHIVGNQGII